MYNGHERDREREREKKRLFDEMVGKNFLNLRKKMDILIQESSRHQSDEPKGIHAL
jgi:hypothetical protein